MPMLLATNKLFPRHVTGLTARGPVRTRCVTCSGAVLKLSVTEKAQKLSFRCNAGNGMVQRSEPREWKEALLFTKPIPSSKTGLPMTVYISRKRGDEEPQVKVIRRIGRYVTVPWIGMTVDDKPRMRGFWYGITGKELYLVKAFVVLNKELLLDYWHGAISPQDALSGIRRIDAQEVWARYQEELNRIRRRREEPLATQA